MKQKHYHEIVKRLDEDGKLVVGVFLSNVQKTCWLYASDYEAITAKYGLSSWLLNSAGEGKPSYVRFMHNGNLVMVSRLILDAQPRTAVKYRDKNPLNLRSSNLFLHHGGGGCKKRPKTTKVKPLGSGLRIPVVASDV
ncbi:hypothetical protein [Microvirga calopogonii]|uniref:hypothetical protein n=1 Tax=Microvirga calopogonii TaxID=2078013 RepID=UPI000E0DC4E7|nr:hypothetical protein [Microvirga calopogonii]